MAWWIDLQEKKILNISLLEADDVQQGTTERIYSK